MTQNFVQKLVSFCFLFSVLSVFGQGEFRLVRKDRKSDINYLTFKNLNSFSPNFEEISKAFEPVEGEFTVYTFIKEFLGESIQLDEDAPDSLELTHDIIVLKTDRNNMILDAFLYRMEWAEPPFQFMLWRSFPEGANEEPVMPQMKNNLKVSELYFLNEYEMYCHLQFDEETEDLDKYKRRIPAWVKDDILKF